MAAAQYQIGVLVGRPPAGLADELGATAAIPSLPADVAVATPDSLVRHRPDVASAERQLAAERALRRRGQGGLPAAHHGRRERRISRRGR